MHRAVHFGDVNYLKLPFPVFPDGRDEEELVPPQLVENMINEMGRGCPLPGLSKTRHAHN